MADKSIKPSKPERPKPEPVKTSPIKPIPVTPAKSGAHGANCVRCNAAPVEIRAVCTGCYTHLSTMHSANEYVMFNKTYYISCQEGTSLEWLLQNGYKRDIVLPNFVASTQASQVPVTATKELVNSS